MTAAASPRPVADIDAQLRTAITSVYRVRLVLIVVALALLVAGVLVLSLVALSQRAQISQQHVQITQQHAQIVQQEKQLQSSCEFFKPLTGLPVAVPATGKAPAPLGVQIIAGARTAYDGQACGRLPPASASLVTWARFYKIPVVR